MVYETDYYNRNEPAVLDQDMNPQRRPLRPRAPNFQNDRQVIAIDSPLRDHLVAALVARHGKA